MQMLTLGEQYDSFIAQERMLTLLGGFFGSLALLLAAVGLYGLMAHAGTRRVRESASAWPWVLAPQRCVG